MSEEQSKRDLAIAINAGQELLDLLDETADNPPRQAPLLVHCKNLQTGQTMTVKFSSDGKAQDADKMAGFVQKLMEEL